MDYQQSRAYVSDAEPLCGRCSGSYKYKRTDEASGKSSGSVKICTCSRNEWQGICDRLSVYNTVQKQDIVSEGIFLRLYILIGKRWKWPAGQISREQFAGYVTRVAAAIEEMTSEGLAHPTPFEIETAVAFLFFAEENCDLVILEVGMGGNHGCHKPIIKNTILAVLVPISMDHQSFLGNTILLRLQRKKAGIIKPGCSVATIGQDPEALKVIENVSHEAGADL